MATIVQPTSPVDLHIGSQVHFKIVGDQMQNDALTWSSSNQKVLKIDQNDGSAQALGEGRADILLGDSSSAASIVHVKKVTHAELEQPQTDLQLNIDDSSDALRTRVKLHLSNQVEEVLPVTQFDGVTLIR